MPAYTLPYGPDVLTVTLHSRMERSPTTAPEGAIHGFGDDLSPVEFLARIYSTSKLLRTF